MSEDSRTASIVVPTYNQSRKLARLLASLERLVNPETFEVVIVDDCSPDDTCAVVEAWIEKGLPFAARLLRLERNGGPGRARNAGLREARGAIVAFTDSDCVVEPGWLEELVRPVDLGKRIAGVAGKVKALSEKSFLARYNIVNMSLEPQWTPTYQFERTYLVTCNCCYHRQTLLDAGGFPEDIRTPGGEDIAASILLWKQGWRYAYATDAVVFHDFESSLRRFIRTFRNYGYGTALVLHRMLVPEEFHPEWGKKDIENYWDAAGLSPSITGIRSFFIDLIAFYRFGRHRKISHARMLESIPWRIIERLSQSYGWRQGERQWRMETGQPAPGLLDALAQRSRLFARLRERMRSKG